MEKIHSFNCLEVISKRIDVQKLGTNYTACCPFHHEDSPSLVINTQKNFWSCFGCKKGGDAIKFVELYDNLPFKKAYVKLCNEYGLEAKGVKLEEENPKQQRMFKLNQIVADFFQKVLFNTKDGLEALKYLNSRGFSTELIKKNKIGFSFKNSFKEEDSLVQMLLELGFTKEEMKQNGIINSKGKTIFQNRIMFPIINEEQQVLGFVGRTIGNDLVRYLNTTETEIFKKRETLFNINEAFSEIRKVNSAIIFEGPFDVLAARKQGITNVICSLGCSLTKEHLEVIKKYADRVIVCYDGDSAGINATLKAYRLCKENGMDFKCCLLPNKLDPDEYVKSGKSLPDYLLYNQKNIYEYLLQIYINCNKNIENITKIQNIFFGLLQKEESMIQKNILEFWAKNVGINNNLIKKDFVNFNLKTLTNTDKRKKVISTIFENFLSSKDNFNNYFLCLNKNFLTNTEKKFLNSLYCYYKNNNVFIPEIFFAATNHYFNKMLCELQQNHLEMNLIDALCEFNTISIHLKTSKQKR